MIEEELVAEFKVKQYMVRQALSNLALMGLIKRKQNKGTIVWSYTPSEICQIYFVRELLEVGAVEQIPLPASLDLAAKRRDIQDGHGVGSYSPMRPDFLKRARQEQEAMIDAPIKGNRARLVALCKGYIHPSAQVHREASQPELKMGFAASPAHSVILRIAGWFPKSAQNSGRAPARIYHRRVRIWAGQGQT